MKELVLLFTASLLEPQTCVQVSMADYSIWRSECFQRFDSCFRKILHLIEAGGFRYARKSRNKLQMCSYQDRSLETPTVT